MPISGLVVTLAADEAVRRKAIAALAADPRITVGDSKANKLALVLETGSPAEDQAAWNELESIPGVDLVALAFVDFSEVDNDGIDRE